MVRFESRDIRKNQRREGVVVLEDHCGSPIRILHCYDDHLRYVE